jgi:hypothetical protein
MAMPFSSSFLLTSSDEGGDEGAMKDRPSIFVFIF